ncbi:fimbrial protein [Dryocola clanedunensis]
MKKSLLAVGLFAGAMVSSAAFAADGTVNFTGSITGTACKIDTASKDQTVDLGKISSTAFNEAGSTAGAKQFIIKINECPEGVKAAMVRFDGTQVPGNDAVLALNNDAGKATNVGIQISDNDNNVINLYQNSSVFALTTGDNKLNFTARYYALAKDVTPGVANAVTNFTIVYP